MWRIYASYRKTSTEGRGRLGATATVCAAVLPRDPAAVTLEEFVRAPPRVEDVVAVVLVVAGEAARHAEAEDAVADHGGADEGAAAAAGRAHLLRPVPTGVLRVAALPERPEGRGAAATEHAVPLEAAELAGPSGDVLAGASSNLAVPAMPGRGGCQRGRRQVWRLLLQGLLLLLLLLANGKRTRLGQAILQHFPLVWLENSWLALCVSLLVDAVAALGELLPGHRRRLGVSGGDNGRTVQLLLRLRRLPRLRSPLLRISLALSRWLRLRQAARRLGTRSLGIAAPYSSDHHEGKGS